MIGAGCEVPDILPPGAAPVRYRDAIFTSVVKTSDITYGSAKNLSKQTITLKLDIYKPPASDTVKSRPAIIWVHGGSFSSGNKTSPELVDESNTFAKKGYVNASIDYRLEPGGCSASGPTPECINAILEAKQDARNRGRLHSYARRDLWHRPDAHRDRRNLSRCDHCAARGLRNCRDPGERSPRRRFRSRVQTCSAPSGPVTRRLCFSTALPTHSFRTSGR